MSPRDISRASTAAQTQATEPPARRVEADSGLAPAGAVSEELVRSPSGGLISSILGHGPPTDEGALAALRTLPRRAAPDPDFTDPIGAGKRVRERIDLLLELAGHRRNEQQAEPSASATVQARLLTQAAELLAQLGDSQRAHATYAAAFAKDPRQRLAAQQLYRDFVRSGDLASADELLETVCRVAPDARERALALCTRAELAERAGAPAERVIALFERARSEQPASLLAALLLSRRLLQAGRNEDFVRVLRSAAERADVPGTRALLLLEAGRALERAGDNEQALSCFEQAHELDATQLGALLGRARLQLARGDRAAAAAALAELSASEEHAELAAEWTRQRGMLLLDGLDDAAQATQVLSTQSSASGLRALTRAAEAAGELDIAARAREAWAQVSGGVVRSLLEAEQARARRRTHPGASSVPPAGGARIANADELVRKASELSGEPAHLREEHALLCEVPPKSAASLDADVLAFDSAAELSDLPRLRAALQRAAQRWPESLRAGPLIAALDLDGLDHGRPEQRALWEALSKLTPAQPVVTRYLAARASGAEQSAQLWLAEALSANDGHAAFAATMAGHYLESAGLDATDAYGDALDAQRGYLPAAFGMEIAARARAELSALERIHREIADTCASGREQSARYVRLGLLNADTDLSSAAHWLRIAADNTASDAILDELSIRLAMDQSPAHQADLLETAADRQRSPAYARAMRLQAAEAHEIAGQWDDAVRIYRSQLAENPEDLLADCALLTCLRRRGRPALLAAELERRVQECDEPASRAVMLEEWAQAQYAQGDAHRAHGLWQRAVAEQAQNVSVSALRALERHALQTGDNKSLRQYTQQLSEALDERVSSAAELRLCIRACRRLGVELYAPLMAAEGRIRESWYAQELEALALRSDDRLRLYEAMCMQAELARERRPLERAAYALRAAEVLEQSAPARAARELADSLSCTREHPLATEQLARLYKAAGDTLAAAHTFTRAARSSGSPQRALALHYTAATLFQDELDEPGHALENLRRAGKLDLLFADTFTRLSILLKREGNKAELLEWIEARTQLPHEPRQGAQLHLERYALLIEQGELSAAEQALVAALVCDPGASQVLFALGELQARSGAYTEAAATWQKLIQNLDETSERKPLADVFHRLGQLQLENLDDPAAAEVSLRRGLLLAPDHTEILTLLAQLYGRQKRLPDALSMLDKLLELEHAPEGREQLIIQQARLRDSLGDHSGAALALDLAERAAPLSLPLLRAHAELLESVGARDTREAVLLRGCEALRKAIEQEPSELKHWLGLHELLRARGATDAAALVAHAAHALGHIHSDLPDPLPRGLGAQALAPAVLKQIAPRGAITSIAALLGALGPTLDPHLPFEHETEPMLASLARDYAPSITPQFGLGELRISRCEASLCVPLSAAPLHVCLGSTWFEKASDAERTFALLRALAMAKLDLTLLARCAPERLGLVLNALWSVVDRTHMVVVLDATEQNRVAAELSDSIDPSERPRTKLLVDAVAEQDDINPRRLQNAAFDYGARVALCVTADVWSGLSSILWMRGRLASAIDARERLALCGSDPALRSLLAFAISEQYAQARRIASAEPQEAR